MLAFMVFIFFCFTGLLAFMFHIFQTMEKQGRILRDDLAQVRVLLRALESRIDSQVVIQKSGQSCTTKTDNGYHASGHVSCGVLPVNSGVATGDPLLHLSFDVPMQETKAEQTDNQGFDPVFDLNLDKLPDSSQ